MDQKVFQPNGAAHIAQLIAAAVTDGTRSATVTGDWEIDTAVRIPGDFTLVLDGCHLRQADGCYSNIFVNEHHDTDLGRTTAGTDRNITILGKNGAILDGGKFNGLSEATQFKDGRPGVWMNNMILFTNVDGFHISGFACYDNRWWALNFLYCANGHIHNIHFKGNDIGVDENGNEYHGLTRGKYPQILVKQADGVDLRQGCHDIVIENLTGFIEDDTVACTALNNKMEKTFKVEGLPTDICNITIRNIRTASYFSNVRLLNQGELKLHDILIDGVWDASEDCPHMDRGYHGVRIGDTLMYGPRHATEEETYNITVKNVRSRAKFGALGLAGSMKNLVLENIEAYDGAPLCLDQREQTT